MTMRHRSRGIPAPSPARLLGRRFGFYGRYGGGLVSGMEQSPDQSHLGPPVAVGQKAVVPDALKAAGQDMQKEAANELLGIERHALCAAPWA